MSRRTHPALAALGVAFATAAPAAGDVVVNFPSLNVRVQALGPALVRVEPEGPRGFEDRPTFAVVGRDALLSGAAAAAQDDLKLLNQTDTEAWVGNSDYAVYLQRGASHDSGACQGRASTDVSGAQRSSTYPGGVKANDQGD